MQEIALVKKTNLIHLFLVLSIDAMILFIVARLRVFVSIVALIFASIEAYVFVYKKRVLEMFLLRESLDIKQVVLSLFLACCLEIFLANKLYINMFGKMISADANLIGSNVSTILWLGLLSSVAFSAFFLVVYIVVNRVFENVKKLH